jgi:prepilin-type N-terminal cleavage/methylation domain-containing protein
MRARSHQRIGFSLLEVMIALTVGGVAVALAAALLRATADQSAMTSEQARSVNTDAVGERVIRRLVGQMEWSRTGDPPPSGTSRRMQFVSWCDVATGWQERCLVELELPREGYGGIIARSSVGGAQRLMPGRPVTAIIYLVSSSGGGEWANRWLDATSLPRAVGLEVGSDTLIVRLGDRG